MSEGTRLEPPADAAVESDDRLMAAHEPARRGGAGLGPLPAGIAVSLVALCLLSGAYLDRYAGRFSPLIYDENARPSKGELVFKVDPVVLGRRYYKAECVSCHRSQGEGSPGIYPPLAGSEWVTGPSGRVIRIVVYGLRGKLRVGANEFNASTMPVYGRVLNSGHNWSDRKIAAVLTYIRQEWGNEAGPISEEDVAAVRKAVGNRDSMSQEELEQVK
jgi:mono/diheme cytochrome c family protein